MALLVVLVQEGDFTVATAPDLRVEKLRWALHMERHFNNNSNKETNCGGLVVEV